jgi:hypothetical protein
VNKFFYHIGACLAKLIMALPLKSVTQQKLHKAGKACATICMGLFFCQSANAQLPAIGYWREHLPYNSTLGVAIGNDQIYAATPYNVFSIDADKEVTRFSKTNGLNDVGVGQIAFDETSKQLLIAYTNSNIDLLDAKDRVHNVSDIKRSNVIGDKTVYNVFFSGQFAYLCTGIGVVVVDVNRYEIKDSYFIGNNGNKIKVTGFAKDAQYFYAATTEGLKRANIASANLADYRNWVTFGSFSQACENVFFVANKIVVQQNNRLLNSNGTVVYADVSFDIQRTTATNDKLLVCHTNSAGGSKVVVVNANTSVVEKTLAQAAVISLPKQALLVGNDVWIADLYGGLSKFVGNSFEKYIPNGPPERNDAEMLVNDGVLWAAAGSVNSAWNYQYNRNGIYRFEEGSWKTFSNANAPIFDSLLDFVAIAIDPRDQSLWAGSYGGGLANINGNAIKVYKQNSSLQSAIGDPLSYRVSGLAFDAQANLWIANYGAARNLSVRKVNGQFLNFAIPFFHTENAISQMLVDDEQQIWIVSPKTNGLFCYNPGANIDNIGDDKWKFYKAGRGNGNLPDNDVFCIAKDKANNIWVGTAKGVGVIGCSADVFSAQGCDAVLPIVQQDRFAGYLLSTEEVRSIAIDGANRKWIATANGVYLLSADGDKTINRFTEENSPLLSNDVKKITIDPQTGEVYFATFKGLCSFRGTATDGDLVQNENSVLVFPNPVPPDFNGTIAIKGLVNNATVKIAELNGRLVFQTKALGGQAVWNGKNYKGEKVASGVYLVLSADETNEEKVVTKIVVVR